jgi:ribosomal protein S18 acetylase RimI-like enzyme
LPITIKRIVATDTALFAHIAADVFDESIHPERLKAYLAQPGHLMVLAFDGELVVGQCVGVIHYHPDKVTELYVDELGTATSHLRQGIATAMMNELFAWARERGCEEAWLGTELDNDAANSFYGTYQTSVSQAREDTIKYYEFDLRSAPTEP